MFSLQSDFSRHSLIILLSPEDLRMVVKSHVKIPFVYIQHRPMDDTMLKQSSGAKGDDIAQSILQCSL